jgi:hypothetical protein
MGMDRTPSEGQFEGMPEPYGYWLVRQGGEVLVGFGRRVMFHFDERDVGMRNLAVVALTEPGAKGTEVAALFELSPVYVSRLRRRAVNGGSRALVPPRGAPRKLSAAAERRALELSEGGETGAQIAGRLSVSEATISRLLARRRGPVAVQGELVTDVAVVGQRQDQEAVEHAEQTASGERPIDGAGDSDQEAVALGGEQPADGRPIARLGEVEVRCRYAGAMLLHPFLDRLGAEDRDRPATQQTPLSALRFWGRFAPR